MMKILTLTFAFLIGLNLIGQKSFEGVVRYESFFKETNAEAVQLSYWVYLKNQQSRTEETFLDFKRTRIVNVNSDESCVLLELLGQRFALCDKISNIGSDGIRHNLKVQFSKEKKEIAGYKCKKATLSNDKISILVYYTEELPNWEGDYPEVPGMPLEIEYEVDGLKVHHVAVDISTESLEDHLFEIPDSYEKLNQQQFQERFGSISTE